MPKKVSKKQSVSASPKFASEPKPAAAKSKKPSISVAKLSKSAAKKSLSRRLITIDHPSSGDKIGCHHYAVRISCSGVSGGAAEIAIDANPWQPCREAVGYRWFDWHLVSPGKHTLIARLLDDGGAVLCESAEVVCEAR